MNSQADLKALAVAARDAESEWVRLSKNGPGSPERADALTRWQVACSRLEDALTPERVLALISDAESSRRAGVTPRRVEGCGYGFLAVVVFGAVWALAFDPVSGLACTVVGAVGVCAALAVWSRVQRD